MTFKKINKSAYPDRTPYLSTAKECFIAKRCGANRAQSIFEYFILTAVTTAAVLFFVSSSYFQDIQNSCQQAFNRCVGEILK